MLEPVYARPIEGGRQQTFDGIIHSYNFQRAPECANMVLLEHEKGVDSNGNAIASYFNGIVVSQSPVLQVLTVLHPFSDEEDDQIVLLEIEPESFTIHYDFEMFNYETPTGKYRAYAYTSHGKVPVYVEGTRYVASPESTLTYGDSGSPVFSENGNFVGMLSTVTFDEAKNPAVISTEAGKKTRRLHRYVEIAEHFGINKFTSGTIVIPEPTN